MVPHTQDTAAFPALEGADLRVELAALGPGLEIILTRALGPTDAADAVQEVLARACTAIDGGRVIHGPLGAFVYGIAQHVIADARRMPQPVSADLDLFPAAQDNPLEKLVDEEDRRAMRIAVARLDRDERDLLLRCFVAGEKTSAIAEALGEPANRVRKRKSRALERLRGLLNAVRAPRHTRGGDPTRKT